MPVWFLFFFVINAVLHRSKQPEWFNLYSTPKVLFIITTILVCWISFIFINKLTFTFRLILFLEKISAKFYWTLIITALLSAIPHFVSGISVGEDIGGQVKTSVQWINGSVSSPNIIRQPNPTDLSSDNCRWILRSPGATLLPIPFMLAGVSIGHSLQFGLLICSLIGSFGWLRFFSRLNICKSFLLIGAIMLGLMAGNSISCYATANIILFALVPWFLLWALKIESLVQDTICKSSVVYALVFILLLLGSFVWIKLSGIIVAGTIGACLLFMLFNKLRGKQKFYLITVYALVGLLFWIPFYSLEKINFYHTGVTADKAYEEVSSEIEAPLTGKHWLKSTRSGWLVWSLVAAPGYALPTKSIAICLRDLGKQFMSFREWMDNNQINDHVLLAGLLGFILSVFLLLEFKLVFHDLNPQFKIILLCFLTIPFLGLSILAYRFQWNYLLYHSHTFEFWLVFLLPIALSCAKLNSLKHSSLFLCAVCVAFPLTKNLENIITQATDREDSFTSKTELKLGLSSSRFSKAIEKIESDSKNVYDILFFLPKGDSGDLILRTKMRTLSTHFSGDNFQNSRVFLTAKPLNVYCAYDSSLAKNSEFMGALSSKFPQAFSKEIIFEQNITVLKLRLIPNHNKSFQT